MSAELSTCALCPRLCRPACPVTTGTGREAAVPTFLAAVALDFERGTVSPELAEAALTLCADCGACEEHCHIHHPLPGLLSGVRTAVSVSRPVEPIQAIEGDAETVAIEVDERSLASVVAKALGIEVARWPTSDRFGAAHRDSEGWHAGALRAAGEGRRLIVADGGVAQALDRAGLGYEWLSDLVPSEGCTGSCAAGGDRPLACCGGGGPLPVHHPEDAKRVALAFARRWTPAVLVDSRCRSHLRSAGVQARDLLDRLLEEG